MGLGGTLGTINWFQGEASAFYGFRYQIDEKIAIKYEHTTDKMLQESSYLKIRSPIGTMVFHINLMTMSACQHSIYMEVKSLSLLKLLLILPGHLYWAEKSLLPFQCVCGAETTASV